MTTIIAGSGAFTYAKNYSYYASSAAGTITVVNDLLLGAGDELYVLSGGTASSVVVDSGAGIDISNGGVAYDITLNQGGASWVQSSGAAVGVYIHSGSLLRVNGTAENVVIYSGALARVAGVASHVIVSSGGLETVYNPGIDAAALYTTLEGGVQSVYSQPGIVGPATVVRDTVIDRGGIQYLSGNAYSTTINAGGQQDVLNNVVAPGIYMQSHAFGDVINAGGIVKNLAGYTSGTTINNGGIEFVFHGAAAQNTSIEAGGYLVGLDSSATGSTSGDGVVVSSGLFAIVSGRAEVNDLVGLTLLGANDTEFVLPGGSTNGEQVSAGIQYVYGGVTNATTIFSAGEEIIQSGTALNTFLDGGTLSNIGGTLASATIGTDADLVDSSAMSGSVSFSGTRGTLIIEPQSEPYPIGETYPSELPEIYGFTLGDAIELPVGRSIAAFDVVASEGAATITYDTQNAITGNPVEIVFTLAGVSADQVLTTYTSSYPDQSEITFDPTSNTAGAACFVAGTRISTDHGDVPVEKLHIGEVIKLAQGGNAPVKWIGRRTYARSALTDNKLILPICIKANAVDDGIPTRDLWLSPGHAICIDAGLIHTSKLVNGVSVIQAESLESVTYFHIELENHEIIVAENCPVESFMDEDFRGQFENAADYQIQYAGCMAPNVPCLPRIERGLILQAVRERLAKRAGIPPRILVAGPVRGFVDVAGPSCISGWVQDIFALNEPVSLDMYAGGQLVVRDLADIFRPDVRDAGIGAGFHGFELPLQQHVTMPIEIRRSSDQRLLTTIRSLRKDGYYPENTKL